MEAFSKFTAVLAVPLGLLNMPGGIVTGISEQKVTDQI